MGEQLRNFCPVSPPIFSYVLIILNKGFVLKSNVYVY